MPLASNTLILEPMSSHSIAYIVSAENYIAEKVFPVVPVQRQSSYYYIFDPEDWFRDEFQKVADGEAPEIVDFDLSKGSYWCDEWGLGTRVTKQQRANSPDPLKPNEDAVDFLTQKYLISKEVRWVDTYFKTGVWTTEWAGVAGTPATDQVKQWDQANSTPVDDIKRMKRIMLELTGFEPNVMVLGKKSYDVLTEHSTITDRIKYTSSANVTREMLAARFELDNVYVSAATKNSAAKKATKSMATIAGRHVGLFYVPKNPGLKTPSAGMTYSWEGLEDSNGSRALVKSTRESRSGSDIIDLTYAEEMKKTAEDMGGMILNVVGSD